MKKILAIFLVLTAITTQLQAVTQSNNYYFGIGAGFNYVRYKHHDIDYHTKPGFIALIDAGLSLCYGFRFEGEFAYRFNKIRNLQFQDLDLLQVKDKGKIQQYSLLFNLIYDFNYFNYVTPFIGAGAGYAIQKVSLSVEDFDFIHDKRGFAWQVFGGMNFCLCPKIIMNIRYHYFRGSRDNMWNQAGIVGFNFLLN